MRLDDAAMEAFDGLRTLSSPLGCIRSDLGLPLRSLVMKSSAMHACTLPPAVAFSSISCSDVSGRDSEMGVYGREACFESRIFVVSPVHTVMMAPAGSKPNTSESGSADTRTSRACPATWWVVWETDERASIVGHQSKCDCMATAYLDAFLCFA